MTGAELLVETLRTHGVTTIFSLSGNQILSVYDATIGRGIGLLHTRHEAAAAHMADGWGRLTEIPGVALVTAGRGHLNAVSALYTALMAESPMVLLSGHSPRAQRGRGAFQELDQVGAARPITIVAVIGNDARWNAEHQLQFQHYGEARAVACELLPTRYDRLVEALGGHGELVERAEDLRPALGRAVASGKPACVNVMIDGVAAPTYRAASGGH